MSPAPCTCRVPALATLNMGAPPNPVAIAIQQPPCPTAQTSPNLNDSQELAFYYGESFAEVSAMTWDSVKEMRAGNNDLEDENRAAEARLAKQARAGPRTPVRLNIKPPGGTMPPSDSSSGSRLPTIPPNMTRAQAAAVTAAALSESHRSHASHTPFPPQNFQHPHAATHTPINA
jgi:hypothetical protein